MLKYIRAMLRLPTTVDHGFIETFKDVPVYAIAATESEGIDSSSLSKEQLHAEIQRQIERDREGRQSGSKFFIYTVGQQRHLPFFTSAENAKLFCDDYSREQGKIFPFRVLQTKGKFLGTIDPDSAHVVIMNDRCPGERALTARELARAQRLWG
jgi:hypothetical protein